MNNIQKIEIILKRMAELLRIGEDYDWASVFEELHKQLFIDSAKTAHKIRISYGGMGSLNDIVLHKNKKPLKTENEEFDILRAELYEICGRIL